MKVQQRMGLWMCLILRGEVFFTSKKGEKFARSVQQNQDYAKSMVNAKPNLAGLSGEGIVNPDIHDIGAQVPCMMSKNLEHVHEVGQISEVFELAA